MKQVEELLIKAIEKIPKKEIALLFSGGIDSLALAYYLKKLNYNFTCYTVGLKGSPDVKVARELAKELYLKHEVKIIDEKKIPSHLKKIVNILNLWDGIEIL